MNAKEKDMFLAWGRTAIYAARVQETKGIIKDLIFRYPNCCAAVSGGKDSSVMLHLIMEVRPDVLVWHWDWGMFMLREFEAQILAAFANFFHISPPQLTVKARLSQDPDNHVGYRALFGSVSQYLKDNKIQLTFMGLRKEESCRRSNRCRVLVEKASPCPNAFPLRLWTWRDIWAYIVLHGIPYPSAYDIRAPFLGWDKTRFVSFFDPEFDHLGGPEQDKFFFWQYREK